MCADQPVRGIVVETGDPPDVRAGDILVGWQRDASPPANPEVASGELRIPFHWAAFELIGDWN